MKWTSHMTVGIATGVVLSEQLNINPLVTVGLAAVGSIVVDIDEVHSKINQILFPCKTKYRNTLKMIIGTMLLAPPNTLSRYFGVLILLSVLSNKAEYKFSVLRGIDKRSYHRTYFHDPIIGTLIFFIPIHLMNIPFEYKVAFMAGVLVGHYFMDMFTHYGLPVYILGIKHFRIPFIHFDSTNKIAEKIVVVTYILILIGIKYPSVIKIVQSKILHLF